MPAVGRAGGVSRQLTDWGEPPVRDRDALYATVEVLVSIGEDRGVSPAQVALAWLPGRPAVTSLVIGAKPPGSLRATSLRLAWS